MPLTVCPNCATPMNEVQRRGVYVDVCPACRGVWLDGGELEAMLAAGEAASAAAPRERYVTRDDYRRDHGDEDDRRRGGGLFDLFGDLFD